MKTIFKPLATKEQINVIPPMNLSRWCWKILGTVVYGLLMYKIIRYGFISPIIPGQDGFYAIICLIGLWKLRFHQGIIGMWYYRKFY